MWRPVWNLPTVLDASRFLFKAGILTSVRLIFFASRRFPEKSELVAVVGQMRLRNQLQ